MSYSSKKICDTLPYDPEKKEIMLRSIGKSIREERVAKKMSLKELSIVSNVSESLLRKIEAGSANPSISNIIFICYGLDLLPDDIIPHLITKKTKSNGDFFNLITKRLSDDEVKEIFEVVKTMVVIKQNKKQETIYAATDK